MIVDRTLIVPSGAGEGVVFNADLGGTLALCLPIHNTAACARRTTVAGVS